jgi:hypothetical protein
LIAVSSITNDVCCWVPSVPVNLSVTSSEIALINDNGLSFFPIYQEFGDSIAYFDHDQGHAAGVAACAAARGLGIPQGTVLYVAVDFDAIDDEITTNVIPQLPRRQGRGGSRRRLLRDRRVRLPQHLLAARRGGSDHAQLR